MRVGPELSNALVPTIAPGMTAFPQGITQLGDMRANPVQLDEPKVHHLPAWKTRDDPARVRAIRQIVIVAGRDPRMATLAVGIVRADPAMWAPASPPPARSRDTFGQAALLLKWVQERIYYVNEPGERLQDPFYTLQVRYGDCDDMAILLAAFLESLRIPWRFVLSGRVGKGKNTKTVRWMEGQPRINAEWAHIYVAVGDPPFQPKVWKYAEPTIRGVPLGWDVVGATKNGRVILPELAGVDLGAADPEAAPLPFTQHVVREIKDRLHPRSLIPLLVVGFVSGAVADQLRRAFK